MLTTRACTLLGIAHPVILGGMVGPTNPELVAAVSEAGGLGILGCTSLARRRSPAWPTRSASAPPGLSA